MLGAGLGAGRAGRAQAGVLGAQAGVLGAQAGVLGAQAGAGALGWRAWGAR